MQDVRVRFPLGALNQDVGKPRRFREPESVGSNPTVLTARQECRAYYGVASRAYCGVAEW